MFREYEAREYFLRNDFRDILFRHHHILGLAQEPEYNRERIERTITGLQMKVQNAILDCDISIRRDSEEHEGVDHIGLHGLRREFEIISRELEWVEQQY